MPTTIRPETESDSGTIHRVHAAAFETDAEARLVDALRENSKLIVSLAAELDGEIAGHIAFSPVTVNDADVGGIGLAPVAVLPAHQREGIGGALIRAGIDECDRLGYGFIVLLGHPEYYPRFGFKKASDYKLDNEYGADDAFMAYEIKKGSIPNDGGLIKYATEFAEL